MKFFILFAMFISIPVKSLTFETRCRFKDCFREGWTTTIGKNNYKLECYCKDNDCINKGWSSSDSLGSYYDVICQPGGCTKEGWYSREFDNGVYRFDYVTCKYADCLKYGWTIKSSYDAGGEVTCFENDCSRFGGFSFWRGRRSRTLCYGHDCYKNGWSLEIF